MFSQAYYLRNCVRYYTFYHYYYCWLLGFIEITTCKTRISPNQKKYIQYNTIQKNAIQYNTMLEFKLTDYH